MIISNFPTNSLASSKLNTRGGLNLRTFLYGPSVLSKTYFSLSLEGDEGGRLIAYSVLHAYNLDKN